MATYQRNLVCALGIILMVMTFPLQGTSEEVPSTSDADVGADIQVDPEDGVFFSPEALSNPSGFTTAIGQCFPKPTPKTTFNQGELVWFNVYWIDTVEPDQLNVYNVTAAVQAGSLLIFYGPAEYTFNVAPDPPNLPIEFCFRVNRIVPPTAPSGFFPWGARVIKRHDNTSFQQQLNVMTVQ